MSKSRFFYVTYIRTSPEKLWQALTAPEFTRQYWGGVHQESDWKVGGDWKLMIPDGRVGDSGKIIEIDPPRKLVVTWENQFMPELKAEGPSRMTFLIEPRDEHVVKLTLTHEMDRPDSKLIEGVGAGWPELLASMKSLVETGAAFPGDDKWPEGV
ncbi:MAG: SRPBCC family protein [Caulobacterales bacterium]